ncbi:hypothetical protein [Desulfoluna spongiiphila]|uniref:hypothetical protein n=1 Tax=Desulfoluna spongiiphila TaxID=419481 RepID=UPI0012592188|nr:hypothetical protein [Desulfoluna spongiiphila]VVS94112.1 hypothetical protein DBB_36840 [Desulfoluna spongiiphila]
MNSMKRCVVRFLPAAMVILAVTLAAGPAAAGLFDFTHGRIAAPGSDLYALGTEAIEQGLGGTSYFTNGEGRVVEVRAKEMASGDLRVTVRRVHIPKNYVADTHDGTLEAERTYTRLEELAEESPWVGGYAVLPHNEGYDAYKFGVMVETEFNRNHSSGN